MTDSSGNTNHSEGELPDPFYKMALEAGQQPARISFNIGRAIEYGELKASCTVSIVCAQYQPTMDAAAELAMDTALRYTNHAMRYLAPDLRPIPGPITNGS